MITLHGRPYIPLLTPSFSLGFSGVYLRYILGYLTQIPMDQAAFDSRILASVCFFATDIHSATLGKGKNDDTLVRVRKGDLNGKGELVVCLTFISKSFHLCL